MAVDPGPHVEDPDPRGPDFDTPPQVVDARRFETYAAIHVIPVSCPVCGLVHESEPDV